MRTLNIPTMMAFGEGKRLFRLVVEAYVEAYVEAGQASSREMTRCWNGVVSLAGAVPRSCGNAGHGEQRKKLKSVSLASGSRLERESVLWKLTGRIPLLNFGKDAVAEIVEMCGSRGRRSLVAPPE